MRVLRSVNGFARVLKAWLCRSFAPSGAKAPWRTEPSTYGLKPVPYKAVKAAPYRVLKLAPCKALKFVSFNARPSDSPLWPALIVRAVVGGLLGYVGAAGQAHGAVAVLLEQPYGKLNIFEPAGHTAIYFNHICAAGPLRLRPCRAGELGVVVSRYDDVGDHDWIAMPLIPYLYAVGSSEEIPDRVDRASVERLRDTYRRGHLEAVAADRADGTAPDDNWYELVGAAFDRTIYGFQVETSAEQDARLIATFNDQRNEANYNGFTRNCADFVRVTVNLVYPHAVRRNYVADLGMSSPKSVARGLVHYARRHPETGLSMFVVPQVKGDLPRSHENTVLAEGILKRYGVPLAVFSPATTAVVLAAYVGQGMFEMPKDAPVLDVSAIQTDIGIMRPFPGHAPKLPAPVATIAVRGNGPAVGMLRVGAGH